MSARPAARGVMANALNAVAGWLVEPAARDGVDVAEPMREPVAPVARPVVAVAGLRNRAGVTTVARAVAVFLGGRDPAGACVVSSEDRASALLPLGLPAAGRLGRRLGPLVGGRVRPCGRLCLIEGADPAPLCAVARDLAPVVLDVSDPAAAAAAASLADHVVLVAVPQDEPALAAVVAESLAGVGPSPVVVINRCGGAPERWDRERRVRVPESRVAAQLAGAGREPRGPMGQAIAALVDVLPAR